MLDGRSVYLAVSHPNNPNNPNNLLETERLPSATNRSRARAKLPLVMETGGAAAGASSPTKSRDEIGGPVATTYLHLNTCT